jgi:gas vesicle protein
MNLLKHVTKIRVRISRGLATQHPVKLLGVLALGAIVMAGTGLYFAPNSANEMSTHPLNEDLRIVPDDEWMYGQQNYEAALAANLARREDEVKATMRRVEAYVAANKSYEAARAANLARREDEAKATMRRVEAYIAANKANEIAENFSRIREEGRAADRQDDLQDMVQYWKQLK